VKRLTTEHENRIDVILSDPSPGELVKQKSRELGIPMVSCDYVIHSILLRKKARTQDFQLAL
jgi:hypothetical protein